VKSPRGFDRSTAVAVGNRPFGMHDLYKDARGNLCLVARTRQTTGKVAVNSDTLIDFEELKGTPWENKYVYLVSGEPPLHEWLVPLEELPEVEEINGRSGRCYIFDIPRLRGCKTLEMETRNDRLPAVQEVDTHNDRSPTVQEVGWNGKERRRLPLMLWAKSPRAYAALHGDLPSRMTNPSVESIQAWLKEHPGKAVVVTAERFGVGEGLEECLGKA
jgi:hypothetical protein